MGPIRKRSETSDLTATSDPAACALMGPAELAARFHTVGPGGARGKNPALFHTVRSASAKAAAPEEATVTKRPRKGTTSGKKKPAGKKKQQKATKAPREKKAKAEERPAPEDEEPEFLGEPVPADEARAKWPQRYQRGAPKRPEDEEDMKARVHYRSAMVDGVVYALGDDVYVMAGENEADYIGRITEFFEGVDKTSYFTCRWYFRPEDTVISRAKFVNDHTHDPKRVFLSEEKNDNPLDCIISKVKIIHVDPNVAKAKLVARTDLYYDMSYTVAYSTFANIPSDTTENSGISTDADSENGAPVKTASLLDLYSGCGGMSTGLCLGSALAGLKLETVRNEKAEDFLALLKEWAILCDKYVHSNDSDVAEPVEEEEDDEPLGKDEFVVEKLLEICYGGTGRKNGIHFKVQWKGYGPEEDTWEPIENLSDCPLKIKEFVQEGYRRNILPQPGQVDVICGGPPCQGISGFNRFRNRDNPLEDEKNQQMVTYMDIVSYLQPKFVLMENVVDILKFADGYLGRYALSRLVSLNYQARLGMMVAGCYGLPQFRMRVFLWGALPTMVLPKYPLPTHDVVVRGGAPNAFSVDNYQPHEVIEYGGQPKTDFQRYIRLSRKDMLDYSFGDATCPEEGKLLDHQPLRLNQDDYDRVQQIPIKKGANFRDLPGVKVGANNIVEWDPEVERVYLKSGKPLVPDYAMSFIKGRSPKPFGRLWWDETVPTVVTRAEPHNQIILHPNQGRVLTVRENARLQGFPDYYRMYGPMKEKYIQVGNAVAVPVARALGYSLGRAYQGEVDAGYDALFVLPDSFTNIGQTGARARASSVGTPAGEVVEQ
uniref:DNA (cytosine-5-)-methyltransferase n=1 Tax=Aegilops tauschii TaxID=37682 RepID=M8BRB2_AEGTA